LRGLRTCKLSIGDEDLYGIAVDSIRLATLRGDPEFDIALAEPRVGGLRREF